MAYDPGSRDKLAAWVASGRSVAAFAKKHAMSVRTCYGWARRDDFQAKVERIRRRMLDRIGGTLTRNGLKAVDSIVTLSKTADADAVKLAAAKAILDKLIEVANMVEIDRRLKALEDGGKPTIPSLPPRTRSAQED